MSKIKGAFAKTYDNFLKRGELLPTGLAELVKSFGVSSVVDFGCGTGTLAVGLAKMGYDVTGVDHSPDMLKMARVKASGYRATVKFIAGDIIKIDLERKFDLLLCTGNTIALISKPADFARFLSNCRQHLRPGGHILFQQLNYDRMLEEGSGTFAVELGDNGIIRIKQNQFRRGMAEFIVTIIDSQEMPPVISTSKGTARPRLKVDLTRLLREAGFSKIRAYGNYGREPFGLKSKDLILIGNI